MDGMGHGGFARGQTKDLRKGLKTREGRAKLTSFKQLPAPFLNPKSVQPAHPMCPIQFISPEGAWYPHSPAIGGRISS